MVHIRESTFISSNNSSKIRFTNTFDCVISTFSSISSFVSFIEKSRWRELKLFMFLSTNEVNLMGGGESMSYLEKLLDMVTKPY
jgi:hypothetical protein